MPTLERKRERAAQLYLMAGDAFGRGDANLAQMLMAKANQYADEAAALAIAQQEQELQSKV
jgi:phage shock protein A